MPLSTVPALNKAENLTNTPTAMMQVEAATKELKKVYNILAGDVETARRIGQSDPSPFAHRTLFRTYFALIEGLSYQFRSVSIACAEHRPGLLSEREVAMLKEERYSLNKKGEPEVTSSFQKTLPNILFSMRCYAKVHGVVFEPNVDDHGWEALRRFVELRNGLEHPKLAASLEVNEAKIRDAIEAASWWKATVLELLKVCREADEFWRAKLQ